jgi:glucose-6-phosphate 1-dehydrogenase
MPSAVIWKRWRQSRASEHGHAPLGCIRFLGATGDLAGKQIFPALQAMTRHGRLDMAVIRVGRSALTRDQFIALAHDSIEKHGAPDEEVFKSLSSQLQYVGGDLLDDATFQKLRALLGDAVCPPITSPFRPGCSAAWRRGCPDRVVHPTPG